MKKNRSHRLKYLDNIGGNKSLLKEIESFCHSQNLPKEQLLNSIQSTYGEVCQKINNHFINHQQKTLVIGLNGPQGSGKSTLAELLKLILKHLFSLNSLHFSIDDLYKTRQQRIEMSEKTHPLFITRGVPGTHDIALGINTIQRLKTLNANQPAHIPRFNKAIDDREPQENWQQVTNKPDIIIFEGWCVGSTPLDKQTLISPINELENKKDPKGIWRNEVSEYLANEYQALFKQIDFLIYLKAHNFDDITMWRQEQEHKLISKLKQQNKTINLTMNDQQLKEFMLYFERITRHNWKTLPKIADCNIHLSNARKPTLI